MSDDDRAQYWGALDGQEPEDLEFWPVQERAVMSAVAREWSELALWFQSVTLAAGVRQVPNAQVTNVPQDTAAGSGGFPGFTSHRYLTVSPVWKTFALYSRLKEPM